MKKNKSLFLDEIMAIDDEGELDTYDLVIPPNCCFLANSILVHNSGDIEYACDVVLFLHRKEDADTETELIIAKNRDGVRGTCTIVWNTQKVRYDNRIATG